MKWYLSDFSRIQEFYRWNPAQEEVWKQLVEVRANEQRPWMESLADGLRGLYPPGEISPEVEKNIRRLASGALVVMTGQQPCLFGGPAYTLIKAFSTAGVARWLEHSLNRPVVPVFWMVSEDSDFEEICWTYLYPRVEGEGEIRLTIKPEDEGKIFSSMVLNTDLLPVYERFVALLPETPLKEEILGLLKNSYFPGQTFSRAFFHLMNHLLSPLGIILFEPRIPEFQPLKVPFLIQAMEKHEDIYSHIAQAGKKIRKLGITPQLVKHPNRLNLFYLTPEGRRERMEKKNGKIISNGITASVEEWKKKVNREPDAFVGGVVLRPVLQDAIFPTISYVGGPGELLYWGQLRDVFSCVNVVPSCFYCRPQIFFAFSRMHQILSQWDFPFHLISSARSEIPAELRNHLIFSEGLQVEQKLQELLEQDFPPAEKALSARAMGEEVRNIRKQIYQLKEQWQKILRKAEKEKIQKAQAQWSKVLSWFYPRNQPQERIMAGLYFYLFLGEEFYSAVEKAALLHLPVSHFLFYDIS